MKVLALTGPWPPPGPEGQEWAREVAAQLRPWLEVDVGLWTRNGPWQAIIAPVLPPRAFFGPQRLVLDCRPWPPRWLGGGLRLPERAWRDLQLALADHVLCRDAAQRDGVVGTLFALGLVRPEAYRRDPCLERLIIAAEEGLQGIAAALARPPLMGRLWRLPLVARKWALSLPYMASV